MSVSLRKLPVLLAGVAYAADGFWQLRHHQPDQNWTGTDRLIEVLFAVALVASVAAMPTVRRLSAVSRLRAIGAGLAQVGFAGLAVASIASLIHGGNVLGPAFALGLVAVLIGLGTGSAAGLRHGQREWAAPILLVGFVVGMVLGEHGGTVLIGAAWLVVGWLLEDAAPTGARVAEAY